MHHKYVWLNGHQVKIGDVLVGVVAELVLHDHGIDRQASGRADADCVAVGCGLGHNADANRAARTDPVLDHELLA